MLTRYPPFVSIVLTLYYDLKRNTTLEVCKVLHVTLAWMVIFNFVVAEVILLVRSWLVWGKTRRIAIVFGIICTSGVAGVIVVETIFIRSLNYEVLERPVPKIIPRCPNVSGSTIVVVNIILVIIFETFFLVVALVKGVRDYQLGVARSTQGLTYVLYRDGILFFVYLFAASLTNLIAIVTLPRRIADVLVILQGVLHSSLTARVILNLRQAGRDSMQYIERTSGNEPIELTSICYPRTYD